jgi:hypothetical protein
MENQTDSKTPQKIYAGKLCIAASICLIVGISSFFLCLLGFHFMDNLEDLFSVGCMLNIGIVGFAVPFLGLLAIIDIHSNWQFLRNPDYSSKNETMILKIAYSFMMSGLIFAIAPLLLIILGIIIGNIYIRLFPALLSIWFIAMVLLALVMSCISYKLFTKTAVSFRPRIVAIFGFVVSIVAMVAVFLSTSLGYYLIQRIEYSKITETFSGKSTSLNQTSIVPTLDSPCPKNKNVIWCSSFQLAWNRMKEDVIGEPVKVVGAEDLAARLNSAEQTQDDLESDSFYAAAGRIKQGIINKIQKDMAAKFPKHSVPDFSAFTNIPEGILAYAYLTANVPFKYPYRQVEGEFIFTDSNGVETNVGAFGIWGHETIYKRIREQAEILYINEDRNEQNPNHRYKEFVIDLCKHSKPYQVVAAMVEPKDSLAQTLNYIHNQIADFKQTDNREKMHLLSSVDILIVPEMFWKIDHRFDELIDKIVVNANPPMPILEAKQTIKFKLDRYGAVLESEATVAASAVPRNFIFNRPFLVYMKKRGCDQPFFVMWVDNAELLDNK